MTHLIADQPRRAGFIAATFAALAMSGAIHGCAEWSEQSSNDPNRQSNIGATDSSRAAAVEFPVTGGTLSVPAPPLTNYVALAARVIVVGERSLISGGHLGVAASANGEPGVLLAGSGSRIAVGKTLMVETAVLGPGSVLGEIAANQLVIGPTAATGRRAPYIAPPTAPAAGVVAPGAGAVTVASGRTQSLPPGPYATVTVNGTLNLSGGLYQIQRLQLGAGARLVALAASTVRIATGLTAAAGARLMPAAGLPAGHLRIIASGTTDAQGNSVTFAADAQLTALVIARHAFRAGNRLIAAGAIAAEDLFLAPDTRLSFDTGFGCGGDSGCAAGDGCRGSGVCVDALCGTTSAPDGTPCDDRNICTRGDSCHAGVCTAGAPIVTEFPAGVAQPDRLVRGGDNNLWFISAESANGAADARLGRIVPATGAVTTFATNRRLLDITNGPDGNLWLATRLPASGSGLSALTRFAPSGLLLEELVGIPADRVAAGPDGNVWFVSEVAVFNIAGAIKPAEGLITAILFVTNKGNQMTAGPDGNVWMAESSSGGGSALIARITPDSVLTEFPVATPGDLTAITLGPDGNLWFTDPAQNEIGRITPAGAISKFPVTSPGAGGGLDGVTTGPDGNIWFTDRVANRIGRITPAGAVTELACIPTPASGPTSLVAGSDGRLWFTETTAGNIARLDIP